MTSAITRALVVGGTSGVGYAIACRVAADAPSATVIISGRTKPQDIPHPNIEFRPLDASSMRAIKTYADAYKAAREPPLDLLVLSQGVLTMAGRTETPEGVDRKMALHYYGRQLLIREFLPVLKEDATVLSVLDSLNGNPARLNWEDLDLKTTFSLPAAATHCITMMDGMMQQWAAQQQKKDGGMTAKRHFVHAFPGIVSTNLDRELPWYLRLPARAAAKAFGVTPQTSGENLLTGAYECGAADEKQGRFFSYIDNKGRPVPNKVVWEEAQRQKVADHTWKIVDGALAA